MSELGLSVNLKLAAEQFISELNRSTSQFKQAMSGMEGRQEKPERVLIWPSRPWACDLAWRYARK